VTTDKDSHEANIDEPVIGVIKIKIDPVDAPALMREAIEVLVIESKTLPGFTGSQVLVSADNTTIIVLTEWRDHHAWAQSRYDLGVGKFIEHCLIKSTTIEFELYTRRSQIIAPSF
jgi:quinol monooxygenase YgiN